ncbi:CoA transferase [Aurantimonas sp. C2-5-R2]|uniref:CaiB/BaiF CoA transferase family protein n=1 Tax=Aurantimonas sp. C2-5-R2 TaxID=3113713 RepID=UPI002F95BDA0
MRFTDMTWAGAGPFGTKLFSDFGAEVIKVETSTHPDPVRLGGPFQDGVAGINRSGYFASRNSGKKSVSVNVKSEEGRQIVLDLVRESDVISNNFGPGAMDRLGLSYEEVCKVKPDIIYLGMPMYGEGGPRSSLLGVGMTISAMTSLMWLTAYGSDDPTGPGTHYPDHAANPYHAAFAVAAALRYKRRTGKGMKIDLSQVESTINFLGPQVLDYAFTGREPAQTGNRSLRHAPHNIFHTSGEDEWVAIAVESDAQWSSLSKIIGARGDPNTDRLASAAGRLREVDKVEDLVSTWTSKRSASDIVETLTAARIPAARVATSRYLVEEDPDLARRDYWQTVSHEELRNSVQSSPPYKIDGERVELSAPPLFGQDTAEVLSSILGLSREEIAGLRDRDALK